jgi:hypothetical protein
VRIQRARFAETMTNRLRKSVCARFDKSGGKTLATFSAEGGCAFPRIVKAIKSFRRFGGLSKMFSQKRTVLVCLNP